MSLAEQNPLTLVTHQRIVDLINTGIWASLSKDRLSRWLRQFTHPDDRFFATVLLDQFVFRTEQQTLALLRQAFERVLPPMLPNSVGFKHSEILRTLRDPNETAQIRLIPVRSRHDQPGKSADYMARILRRQLGISSKYLLNPRDAADVYGRDSKTVFIFFDDFLGTGQQFEDFINTEALRRIVNLAHCIYIPLIAHSVGIKSLNEAFPKLKVNAAELLTEKSSAFRNSTIRSRLGNITEHQCRQRYLDMIKRCDIKAEKPQGHGDLGLLLAFAHAIPDNTLPIFWQASGAWFPLFDR